MAITVMRLFPPRPTGSAGISGGSWLRGSMRALVVVLLVASHTATAQPNQVDPVAALPVTPTGKLVVGTIPVAPFIIKNDDGSWGGISMDLWKEVARRLKLDYE